MIYEQEGSQSLHMDFQFQFVFFLFLVLFPSMFGNLCLVSILICRDNDGGDWQVDVDMIDGLLSSLVEYLQLENAYNIFILNPKRGERKPKYGYR